MKASEFNKLYADGMLTTGDGTKAGTPEHDMQVSLFRWARLHEQKHPLLKFLHSVPNGGLRDPIVARKLKAEGLKPGVFDINLDSARGGYFGLKIEMKSAEGNPTAHQKEWYQHYLTQGYYADYCYSLDKAKELILWYLSLRATEAKIPAK